MTPPRPDEIEISVFGRGIGEAVAVHCGGGAWALVDSCLDEKDRPAALSYIDAMSIPREDVELLVVTHWHDDHVRGFSALIEACPNARVVVANALTTDEFQTLAKAYGRSRAKTQEPGLREIDRVFDLIVSESRSVAYAVADRVVWTRDVELAGGTVRSTLSSLSPTDEGSRRALLGLQRLMPRPGTSKRRLPNPSPNDLSIVLWLSVGSHRVVLGGDLENAGWAEILNSSTLLDGTASAIKVPHHGSEGAHHSPFWNDHMDRSSTAVVTPYARPPFLPKQSDVVRVLGAVSNLHCAGPTDRVKFEPADRVVQRTLREAGVQLERISGPLGQVRLRRSIHGSTEWAVELIGNSTTFDRAAGHPAGPPGPT